MNSIKSIIRKTIPIPCGPRPLFNINKINILKKVGENKTLLNLRKKNRDKTFYVIRRSPGAGFFSNLILILNHLKICEKKKYIPVIDMKNFTTIYNEKKLINNTFNAWEYYFKNVSTYNLEEVYKSQNVIISPNKIVHNMEHWPNKHLEFKKIYNKYIKVNKGVKKILEKYLKKLSFKNKKILGVHFRGTSYKTSPGHALPATIEQIIKHSEYLLNKYKFEKIFLVTEELNYQQKLKNHFGNKLISINSFRSNRDDAFLKYPRNLHRYKLGLESIIEAFLLSKCSGVFYVSSNLVHAANLISENNQSLFELFNGWNSKNHYIAKFNWYIKKNLPKKIFGLKDILLKNNI